MDPLHHFQVHKIWDMSVFGVDISVSNSVVWMWIAVAVAFFFFYYSITGAKRIPGRMQSLAELGYLFIYDMMVGIIGKDEVPKFFPYVFTIFYFILFCNLLGLIPGSFTPTSQIIVTGTFAAIIVGISFLYGFYRNGIHYLKFFVPSGVPVLLLPLIIPIEIISFLARPVSLSVRLFANMTAGHTMLAVMFFYVVTLPIYGSWLPFGFSVVFTGVEIFIGFIQAYIFTILTCVYINDAIHLH
ncbi:MAG: F0F1 ATP synthase subunit A [Magnetococcales bacterium]|nr:F0F1 ATP synthase subunit A [Magnetococcales bacterium]